MDQVLVSDYISLIVNPKPMVTIESNLETLYLESNEDTFDPLRLPLGGSWALNFGGTSIARKRCIL